MARNGLPVAAALIITTASLMGGCLKRTISITTEPPGALVWLNDVEVGRTPVESDFTFYGTFDVRINREGYEPILTKAEANAPVQELPGIDLVAEALPIRFNDMVRWHWVLTPVAERGQDQAKAEADVLARAQELRGQTVGPSVPTGAWSPPTSRVR